MKKCCLFSFGLFIVFNSLLYSQSNKILDSINKYYRYAKNSSFDINERLQYALKAKSYSDKFDVDSIKIRVQRHLAVMLYSNEMYEPYLALNKENLNLAFKLKDSSAIRAAGINLGSYYLYIEQNDSSYYYYSKALDYFRLNDKSIRKAESLLSLADIQQEEKAYKGAEEDAIAAIKILNQLAESEDTLYLNWSLYNILAIISKNTLNKEKTIKYYDKSISYSKDMKDGFSYEIFSINNKANAYRYFGEYDKALRLFNNLFDIREKYDEDEPDFYPTVLINIAKTKFESGDDDFNQIKKLLEEAYVICKDIDYQTGVMAASLELCRLYIKQNNEELAQKYGNETLKISNEVSNNEYKMYALLELSDLYDDGKGKAFLRQHIRIQDSLQTQERLVQNKFARIELETDQLEAENEEISKENFYLVLLAVGLGLTATLVYLVISQRAKNKELKSIQEQQKANEEIYNLMLGQQDKVEEARSQEKIRVSKELHDGVLGQLFGVRLSLDSLNFSDGKEAMVNRANYIDQLKTIEQDIRDISHKMNTDFISGSGFMDIVSELIENQSKAYGFSHEFTFSDDFSWEFVSNKTKINIYRILQESMQNIYKHAEAKHVKIDIIRVKDEINIYIVDNGKGFDTTKSKKGIGVKNMNSRVKDINGKISFSSEIGKGTSVIIKIPYKV